MAPQSNHCPPDFNARYRLKERLGGGADGTVYRAEHKASGRVFAAKIMLPRTRTPGQNVPHEVHINQQLLLSKSRPSDHHIVRFERWFEAASPRKRIVLLFEHCALGTLDDYVLERYGEHFCKSNAPPEDLVRHFFAQLLEALVFLHEPPQGVGRGPVVHRDIKPSNILVVPGRNGAAWPPSVKLCDFGGALEAGRPSNDLLGVFTPGYVAPEVEWPPSREACKSYVHPALDVYGVGASIYFVILRKTPPVPMCSVTPGGVASEFYSKDLWCVLEGALMRSVGERWTVRDLRDALANGMSDFNEGIEEAEVNGQRGSD
ncbi:kinase-like domain-containing protein [Phyllosticta citribraziliensis]|uniref:non-specific serine/threonine protein kinase n=1 Tax=Phyllosticta citribraziliensis TaxID=989973 RepID=A0ABR1M3A8_9PEZI